MGHLVAKFDDFFMSVLKPYRSLFLFGLFYLSCSLRYLPAVGRFLIVVTFIEDAWRIVWQYGDQIYYLTTYRKYFPWPLGHVFLIVNVCVRSQCTLSLVRFGR